MVDRRIPADPNWRELARRIQDETDPEKMIELIRELIAKFDEERLRKGLPPAEVAVGQGSVALNWAAARVDLHQQ
jgi:hypothetical protein